MEENHTLAREAILAAHDLPCERVEVPEWGGAVFVRAMTAAERDAFERACLQGRGRSATVNLANLRGKLAARTIVDGQGQRVFTDDDADALGGKAAAAVNRVFEVAARLSALTEEDLDELVGESGGERSGASSTASPETSAGGT